MIGYLFFSSLFLSLVAFVIDIFILFGCPISFWFNLLYVPLGLVMVFIFSLLWAWSKEG